MGFAKVTTPLAGVSPIERAAKILQGRPVTIVTAASQAAACARAMPWANVLVNPAPERGMTSSLLVADRDLDPAATLGVMLADKPFVTRATLELCERALGGAPYDVAYPLLEDEPGHPVYFTRKARALLSAIPAGDTLRALRDHPALLRLEVPCDDPGILIDLDTPEAWDAAERELSDA
jgi:CTP:molybdopterin cytidylyltransferase MocA